MRVSGHDHSHAQHFWGVVPLADRLNADPHRTGRGVTIAIVDAGFTPHPDLTEPRSRIRAYHDTIAPGRPLPREATPDDSWHGTQTSVVAAGNGYLSDGLYRSLAPDADVVLVKVGEAGRIRDDRVVDALEWIERHREAYDIRVVNLSLGGDDDLPFRESAIDRAAEALVAAGVTVVAAAGNGGRSDMPRPRPPASAPSVITVGGTDDGNRVAPDRVGLYWSSYGPTIDGFLKPEIVAPAIWVAGPIPLNADAYREAEALSALWRAPDYALPALARDVGAGAGLDGVGGLEPGAIRTTVEQRLRERRVVATHYQHVDGTSFAAPIVTSVVAQMLEANPRLGPAAVKHLLVSTADRLHDLPGVRQGYGMINARRAVEVAGRERHELDQGMLHPPRVVDGRLGFTYHDDAALAVTVVGDFNAWDTSAHPLARSAEGVWHLRMPCPPPGRYRYKFFVNGTRWVDDPTTCVKEPDPYGGFNSVLHVA